MIASFSNSHCRLVQRTGAAALKIAYDMVNEGLATREAAVTRLFSPAHADQLLHPRFKDENSEHYKKNVIAKGIPASPGAGAGYIVLDSERAQQWKADGKQVVLVRNDTSPEDVAGMAACDAIITARWVSFSFTVPLTFLSVALIGHCQIIVCTLSP